MEDIEEARSNRTKADASTLPQRLGERLRNLRKQQKLSLAEVASRVSCSIGYLSQVERGLSSPTIHELTLLAAVLNVDLITGLLTEVGVKEDESPIRRNENVTLLPFRGSAITKRILTPKNSGKIKLFLMTIEPDTSTGAQPYTHAGEEAGYVLKGTFELTIADQAYRLEKGDSFRFSSGVPHAIRNTGTEAAQVVWVNVD